jgi:hypothetical protein
MNEVSEHIEISEENEKLVEELLDKIIDFHTKINKESFIDLKIN